MDKRLSSSGQRRSHPPRIFAVVLLLAGLALAAGGVRLVSLGGSAYYVIAGIALVASGVLLWRGNRWGAHLYGLLTLGTVIWAVAEVGFDGWALAPRILPFLVLGLLLLRPGLRRSLYGRDTRPLRRSPIAMGAIAALIALCAGIALRKPYPAINFPATAMEQSAAATPHDWSYYGSSAAGTRYAPFDQINAANAADLEVAWTYRTGVSGAFKATPLQIGATLYVCLAGNIITALNADTGERRWQYDPKLQDSKVGFTTTCRGVTYFQAPGAAECPERILTATTDARLIAVDAKTGQPCPTFGDNGQVSLLNGMGEVKPGFYYVTSPPTIARGIAVLGGWVADNVEVQEPSGVIRGFNAITGELAWAWDMGRPDVLTAPPEGQTYTRGTPNAWSVFSADEALGLVFIPTGNATPDYSGGHRTPAAEKYASSVVALDAATGAVRWSFQTTHHDIWDYDVPSQPVLVDVPAADGTVTPAVVAPTKRGELFLLDRRTGQPLTAVEEKPAPPTDVPQEWTAKTQPFSVGMPSFAGAPLTEKSMWGITPFDQMLCRIAFRKLRYEGPLTPPSLSGSIQYPGFAGGMNWGSVALDEANHVLIVNSLHLANHVQLYARAAVTKDTKRGMGGGYQYGTPYFAYTMPFLSPIFIPCQQPPYGEIAAVDLQSKQTLWRRPLGTANELGPLGLKLKLPIPIGVIYSGGSMVTRGGLVFIGGTMDRHMRALDVKTGKELWSEYLPNSGQATPMSYISPQSQRQFVVITVPAIATPEDSHVAEPEANRDTKGKEAPAAKTAGGYVIAYALPVK